MVIFEFRFEKISHEIVGGGRSLKIFPKWNQSLNKKGGWVLATPKRQEYETKDGWMDGDEEDSSKLLKND